MTGHRFLYSSRILTALAGTTAAAAMLGTSAGAARAADSELLLSPDGVNYSQTLARPVFGTTTGFVPGSSSSAVIWIRNATTDNAFLSVAALGNGPTTELAADLGLAIHSALGSTPRVPLGGAGSCTDLAIGWALSPGETLRLTFTLDLDRNSSNATRRHSSSFNLRFLLEDQDGSARSGACRSSGGTVTPGVAGPAPAPPPPPAPWTPLAVTGVRDPWAWALAAGAFLTSGAGILAYIRRNRTGSGSDDKR